MEDKLLNFVSKVIIGFAIFTVLSVWLSNAFDKPDVSITTYPVAYNLGEYTLRFESQEEMIQYFTGLSTF